MSFPGNFLKLSIKTQIMWTIIFFSIISVVLIFLIINIYIFEIIGQYLKNYRKYFYSIQEEIFKNIINFQNIFLFNYEDILINIISQIYNLLSIIKYFPEEQIKDGIPVFFERIDFSNLSNYKNNNINNSGISIYYMYDQNISGLDEEIIKKNNNFIKITSTMTNIFKSFRISYYGDRQLFNGVIVYSNRTKQIYSLNYTLLYDFIFNEIKNDNLNEYYEKFTNNISNSIKITLENIVNDNTIIPEIILEKEVLNLLKTYQNNNNIRLFTKYFPYIDYKNEFIHFIRNDDEGEEIFVSAKFGTGLLDKIFLEIMDYFNITTLLVSPDDNTVINIMSCNALFIKSQFYFFSEYSEKDFEKFQAQYDRNYQDFLNKNVTIDKCLLDNENINAQKYLEKYLYQNKSQFFDLRTIYNITFIKLSNSTVGKEYMAIRYQFPDFFLLERKRPMYIYPTYLNIYSFMNFYFPFSYVQQKTDYLQLNFLGMTLSNFYLWLIIFIIIYLICIKLSNDITKPLIKLKNAIDTMSFNDETIFNYKDDDIINEVFVMCKELVNIDKFKENMKGKNFLNEKKLFESNENKNNENGLDNEEKNSIVRLGGNKNLIINNQLFEKNRKMFFEKSKNNFDKEIIVFKDFKSLLKTRPRNQSRKRPKSINKLINKKLDNYNIEKTLKKINSDYVKEEKNIKNKIRDNLLRDSFTSNCIKKNTKITFKDSQEFLFDEENKNDNVLNSLFYALLFYFGKNMFKINIINNEDFVRSTKYKNRKSNILNNDNNNNNGFTDSIRNIKTASYNKYNNNYYNYPDPLFEDNDIDNLYEVKNSDFDKEKKNKELKEQYQIFFKKNNLFYKYSKAKTNPKNNFLNKIKNISDLELDSSILTEIEEEDNKEFSLFKNTMRKNEFGSRILERKSNIFKSIKSIKINKDNNKILQSKKKSIIKNYNKNSNKPKKILRKSISMPIKLLDNQNNNSNQKKLGLRSSVSSSKIAHRTIGSSGQKNQKKPRFNLNENNYYN